MQRLKLKLLSDYDLSKYQQHLFYRKGDNKINVLTFDNEWQRPFEVATIELSDKNEKPDFYTIDYILNDILKIEYDLLTSLLKDTLEVSHIEWYGDRGEGYAPLKEFIYNSLGYELEAEIGWKMQKITRHIEQWSIRNNIELGILINGRLYTILNRGKESYALNIDTASKNYTLSSTKKEPLVIISSDQKQELNNILRQIL